MFIEIKTRGGGLSEAQRDTLSVLSQILRNRKRNINGSAKGRHAENHTPLAKVFSSIRNREVTVRLFGGHLLELSGTTPDNSDEIKWDWRPITRETLTKLLLFENDPDEPDRKIDWRRRYQSFSVKMPELFSKG